MDRRLDLPEDASREDILAAMEGRLTGNKAVMVTAMKGHEAGERGVLVVRCCADSK